MSITRRLSKSRGKSHKRSVDDRYTTSSSSRAIRRACERAFPPSPSALTARRREQRGMDGRRFKPNHEEDWPREGRSVVGREQSL